MAGDWLTVDEVARELGFHRKTIERIAESNSLQASAIDVDLVEIEIPSTRIVHVGSEDDSLTVREEVWAKVGLAVVCHLPFV